MNKPKRAQRRTPAFPVSDNTFTLLMSRFDKVDSDNLAIQTVVTEHIKESAIVHAVVARHSTYWGFLTKSITGIVALGTAATAAWFNSLFR